MKFWHFFHKHLNRRKIRENLTLCKESNWISTLSIIQVLVGDRDILHSRRRRQRKRIQPDWLWKEVSHRGPYWRRQRPGSNLIFGLLMAILDVHTTAQSIGSQYCRMARPTNALRKMTQRFTLLKKPEEAHCRKTGWKSFLKPAEVNNNRPRKEKPSCVPTSCAK